jgi:alpha-N-arabinofuranosidase
MLFYRLQMKIFLICLFSFVSFSVYSQNFKQASVTIDAEQQSGVINPLQYGQFIEHLGRAVNGGIYDEHSALSDQDGFRKDVIEKVKELRTPLLRYPGGTFTKIYHWEDGVGPKSERKKRKNLIWGGIEDNHFGTTEFISYCRKIGAEPFLVVNMATGTPEEAANWVEYCNGTGDTYYANLRRSHGFKEPFNVKYWGIGNEEYAETDAGRDQDVQTYIKDTWFFVKLMKLQDPALKLVLVGNSDDTEWSRQVLEKLNPVCDFLAVHLYSIPSDTTYATLIRSIDHFEKPLLDMEALLSKIPSKVENFNAWYRFPPRAAPIQLAVDEWGIWDINSKKGKGLFQMEYQYNWSHALGVATFLNLFQRHSASIGMATWAQTVNVLAPIMADSTGSYKQTIFTPLKAFRDFGGKYALKCSTISPEMEPGIKALDISCSLSDKSDQIIFTIVNRDAVHAINTAIRIDHLPETFRKGTIRQITFTAGNLYAANSFKQNNAVSKKETNRKINLDKMNTVVAPASFTVLILQKQH